MATVSQNISRDFVDLYTGYDRTRVGIGLQTGTYASPEYARKRTEKLIIGGLSEILYAGFEHDQNPLALPFWVESQYNTVISLNLHYVPLNIRQDILKYVLDTNVARIESNQPIVVDYYDLKRAVPVSAAIVRRYKVVATRVLNTIPLRDWDKVIRRPSRWENHYRLFI